MTYHIQIARAADPDMHRSVLESQNMNKVVSWPNVGFDVDLLW